MRYVLLFTLFFGFSVLAGSLFAADASAQGYKVVQEPQTGLIVKYPQTWRRATPIQGGGIFRFTDANGVAACEIVSGPDTRYIHDGNRGGEHIQSVYGGTFWDRYLARFDTSFKVDYRPNSGFGRGFGSALEAEFKTHEQPYDWKKGLFAVSVYFDRYFIFSCETGKKDFDAFKATFLNLMGQVDFRKVTNEFPYGYVRPMAPLEYAKYGR